MPIAVVCPGCKARFAVSEKFAGKKGPCPKCKAPIEIPKAAAPEIKIAEPEPVATGGKSGKGGGPISKPIARRETKVAPTTWALIGGGVVLVLALAFGTRALPTKEPVIAVGLLALAAPLAVAGYSFLRDDELEPYSGRPLWIRAGICGLAYAALWGLYWPLSSFMSGEVWEWLFVAPAFIAAGGGVAYALLDLDFSSGALHYCFYLIVTLLLRATMGLPPIWAVTPGG